MGSEHFDVLIVGAGLSGVGAGYHLQANCPGKTYAILEVFAIAGVLYLLINLVLITIIRLLEARLTRYLPR